MDYQEIYRVGFKLVFGGLIFIYALPAIIIIIIELLRPLYKSIKSRIR